MDEDLYSGRVSRRGEIDENNFESDEETENSESQTRENNEDKSQSNAPGWEKMKSKTNAMLAVCKGKSNNNGVDIDATAGETTSERFIACTRRSHKSEESSGAAATDVDGGPFNGDNDSEPGKVRTTEDGLVEENGDGSMVFGDKEESTTWADMSTQEKNDTTAETGFNSLPSSRQGYVCKEDEAQFLLNNERSCKSALAVSSLNKGRRHSSFHKSQSSPTLMKSNKNEKTKCVPTNRETRSEAIPEQDSNDFGSLEEQLPGTASRRFSEVAMGVSVCNKLKTDPLSPGPLEINHTEHKTKGATSVKQKGPKDSILLKGRQGSSGSLKSVTWSEGAPKQGSGRNTVSDTCEKEVNGQPNYEARSTSSNKGDTNSSETSLNETQGLANTLRDTDKKDHEQPVSTETIQAQSTDNESEICSWEKVVLGAPDDSISPPILPTSPIRRDERMTEQAEIPLALYQQSKMTLQTMEDVLKRDSNNVKIECLQLWCSDLRKLRYRFDHEFSFYENGREIFGELSTCLQQAIEEQSQSSDGEISKHAVEKVIPFLERGIETLHCIINKGSLSNERSSNEGGEEDTAEHSLPSDKETFNKGDNSFNMKNDGELYVSRHEPEGETTPDTETPSEDHSELENSAQEDARSVETETLDQDDSACEGEPENSLSKWPKLVIQIEESSEEEALSCIIHSDPDAVAFDSLICDVVDPQTLPSLTNEWETLAGKIIRFSAEGLSQTSSELCFLLAIPYQRHLVESWQEVWVRELTDTGTWTTCSQTRIKAVVEEEQMDHSFLDVLTSRLGTFAVVAKPKVDKIQFGAEGGIVTSSVDPRVSVKIAKNTCYGECALNMQVCCPDSCAIFEFRSIKEDNSSFKSATAIIDLEFSEDITNPVQICLPMIMPQKRIVRLGGRYSSGSTRQAPVPDPFDVKELLLFHLKSERDWRCVRYTKVINTPDIPGVVSFEWSEKCGRLVVLCVSKDVQRKSIDPKASLFMIYMTLTPVEVTVDQDVETWDTFSVSVGPKQYGVKRRRLRKDETEHIFTSEAMLRDGQAFDIKIRGNLLAKCTFPKRFLFYASHTVTFDVNISVLDRFSQRSLPHYCGFVQLMDPLCLQTEMKLDAKGKCIKRTDDLPRLLTEICVQIPKPPIKPIQPLVRAPLNVRLNGGVSFETLREVALEFSDEWKKLARCLNVPHARIQSILRNTKGKQPEHVAMEILLSWVKRVPISSDKACLLCEALARCGRPDLVKGIREKDRLKKQQEIQKAMSYNLKKAILIVSRSPSVVFQWRTLALCLGLSKTDVADLEVLSLNNQESCRLALERWHNICKVNATVKFLSKQLNLLGCFHVAELISTAYGKIEM